MMEAGRRIGAYEILGPLGVGGMGEVYRARDLKLDRQVAVKVLPPGFTGDPERVRRFTAEARMASALNHPHLVAVYDVGEFDPGDGTTAHFIAMELVEGTTLREVSERDRPPLKKILTLLAQAADALAAAHEAGIAHRDIKPENILVSRSGYVKVVDFGLGKLREPAAGHDSEHTAVRATDPGMMMGTVGYMSPEQAEGKPADHRSDVFSLGCVLYEAVSGRRAFAGKSNVEILHKILSENPEPLSKVAPAAPAHLQWILRKCLSKDPDGRYQSMKDLAIDLRELAGDLDSGIASSPMAGRSPWSTWLAWTAAAAIVIALAAIAVSWRMRRSAPAPKAIEISRLTGFGNVIGAAISPDARFLSYVTSSQGKQALWLKQIGTSQSVAIRPADAVAFWGHEFSPDGSAIYYGIKAPSSPNGALYRIATLGGASVRILDGLDSSVGFSPDGSKIAFVRGGYPTAEESALMVANIDGSGARVIAKRHEPDFFSRIFFAGPAWSPDGQWIATALLRSRNAPHAGIIAVRSDGSEEKDVSNGRWDRVGQLAYLPDGRRLLAVAAREGVLDAQIWEIPFPAGEPQRITRDLLDYRIVSLSRDARSLVTVPTETDASVWSVPWNGGEPVRLTNGKSDGAALAAPLPDGRLVYTTMESGQPDLWIASADGSERHPLLADPAPRRNPVVSADGSAIAFVTNKTSKMNAADEGISSTLAWVRSDGTGLRLLAPTQILTPAFTPDGKTIVFSTRHEGKSVLARVAVDGGQPVILSSWVAVNPAVSPDGTQIACICSADDHSPFHLCILPIAGGAPTRQFPVRFDSNLKVRWTLDGKALLFNAGPGDRNNIYRQPIDGGPVAKVTHLDDQLLTEFFLTADGKSVVVTRLNLIRDAVLIRGFD